MPSAVKIKKVSEIKEILKGAKALYLIDFSKLNVPEITELRRKVKSKKGILKVVNNRLAKIALKETGIEIPDDFLRGQNALLLAYDDPVEPLKEAYEFIKEIKKGEIKEGVIIGKGVYKREEVINIAKLPSLKELRTKVIQNLYTPIFGVLMNLKGILFNLLIVLKSIEEKKKNL
ncbi:MAG: 50S ribosomal protein L10 [candidate division WOR-3 bacterium]